MHQVHAAEVDPAGRLPFAHKLVGFQRAVPPDAAVQLGERPLLSELIGHRRALLDRAQLTRLIPEDVDARPLHVLVMRHRRAHGATLRREGLLFHHVPHQHQLVRVAPAADLLREVLNEQLGQRLAVVVPDLGESAVGERPEEFRELAEHVIPAPAGKFGGQVRRPMDGKGIHQPGHAGFVGENGGDEAAKILAVALGVGCVSAGDECGHGIRIERVRVPAVVVPAGPRVTLLHVVLGDLSFARSLAPCQWPVREQMALRVQPQGEARDPLLFVARAVRFGPLKAAPEEVRVVPGHGSAGAARGPAVLVVQIRLHAGGAGVFNAGRNAAEPLLGEIDGLQSIPAVHEEAAHPGVAHRVNLAAEAPGIEPVVPGPERRIAPDG